jgi:hypothetical protein
MLLLLQYMLEIVCMYLFHLSLSLLEFARIEFVSVLLSGLVPCTVVHESIGGRRNTSVGSRMTSFLLDGVILTEIGKSYRAILIHSFILKKELLIIEFYFYILEVRSCFHKINTCEIPSKGFIPLLGETGIWTN